MLVTIYLSVWIISNKSKFSEKHLFASILDMTIIIIDPWMVSKLFYVERYGRMTSSFITLSICINQSRKQLWMKKCQGVFRCESKLIVYWREHLEQFLFTSIIYILLEFSRLQVSIKVIFVIWVWQLISQSKWNCWWYCSWPMRAQYCSHVSRCQPIRRQDMES